MNRPCVVDMNDMENGVASDSEEKAKAGTALFLIEVENKRAMKPFSNLIHSLLALDLYIAMSAAILAIEHSLARVKSSAFFKFSHWGSLEYV
ncbi:hypothetical protein RND71_014420 [Anisodus tanguticus]|uniref:Uncharacterized protein n=1 Tax=Anisodus tanguticus TaxID=243964 RepID=A0AAE1SAL3_9SOLA|nr:hypothetical protein RND71_014420 [Anisodus tanguticus]